MKSDNVKWKEYKDYMDEHREDVFSSSFLFGSVTFMSVFLFVAIYIESQNFNTLEEIGVIALLLLSSITLGLFAGLIYMVLANKKLLRNYMYYKITGDKEWINK